MGTQFISCRCVSKTYVILLNVLTLVLSIAIIAFSSYSYHQVNTLNLSEGVREGLPLSGVIIGLVLLLISLLGCCAAYNNNKFLILIYICLSFVATISLLALGIALLAYSGEIDHLRKGKTNLESEVQADLQDFELAVYDACCVKQFNTTPVVVCAESSKSRVCVSAVKSFEDISDAISKGREGYGNVCSALGDVKVDGTPIVGNPVSTGGCGSGDSVEFVKAVSTFLKLHFTAIGSATFVLSVLLVLDFAANCALFFTDLEKPTSQMLRNKTANESKNKNQQTQKDLENGKAGPELAVG